MIDNYLNAPPPSIPKKWGSGDSEFLFNHCLKIVNKLYKKFWIGKLEMGREKNKKQKTPTGENPSRSPEKQKPGLNLEIITFWNNPGFFKKTPAHLDFSAKARFFFFFFPSFLLPPTPKETCKYIFTYKNCTKIDHFTINHRKRLKFNFKVNQLLNV